MDSNSIEQHLEMFLKKGIDKDWFLLSKLKQAMETPTIEMKPEMLMLKTFFGSSLLKNMIEDENKNERLMSLILQPFLAELKCDNILYPTTRGEIVLKTLNKTSYNGIILEKIKQKAEWILEWNGKKGRARKKEGKEIELNTNPFPFSSSYIAYLKSDETISPSGFNPVVANVFAIEEKNGMWYWAEERYALDEYAKESIDLCARKEEKELFKLVLASSTLLKKHNGIVEVGERKMFSCDAIINLDFFEKEMSAFLTANKTRAIINTAKNALFLMLRAMPNAGNMGILQNAINEAGNVWREVVRCKNELANVVRNEKSAIKEKDGVAVLFIKILPYLKQGTMLKKHGDVVELIGKSVREGEDVYIIHKGGREFNILHFTIPYGVGEIAKEEIMEMIKKIKAQNCVINAYESNITLLEKGEKKAFLINKVRHVWW